MLHFGKKSARNGLLDVIGTTGYNSLPQQLSTSVTQESMLILQDCKVLVLQESMLTVLKPVLGADPARLQTSYFLIFLNKVKVPFFATYPAL